MSSGFLAPRGTRDVLPPESALWQRLESIFRDLCARYRYEEIRTPVFEDTRLFSRGIGDSTDIVNKEMYTFTDRGDRSLTLRPEGTASVVRAYVHAKLGGPNHLSKFFYICSIFRYERPQQGRYRQSHQLGVEAIGSPGPDIDAEIIGLNAALYGELGIGGLVLHLNTIGCQECRPAYRDRLRDQLRPHLDEFCPDCQRRFETNPLRIMDCKVPRCGELSTDVPSILDALCPPCVGHWDGLRRSLDAMDLPYQTDPKLVRGLDYYTRTAFEFKTDVLGSQDSLSGGGRYDGLVELCGGKPTPGIGFAAGVERALMALERAGISLRGDAPPCVFVASAGDATRPEALRLLHDLRRAGVAADTDYFGRGLKAQLRAADSAGSRLALIVGDEEAAEGAVALRDLVSGEQVRIPRAEAVNRVNSLLAARNGANRS